MIIEGEVVLTIQMMRKLWPHSPDELRQGIVDTHVAVFHKYGLEGPTVLAQFMAQGSHECGGGTEIIENLSYSALRMMQVWPSRFHSLAEAMPYAHKPQLLANKVYNGRMGNRTGTNDGWNYRGRGMVQTTGRDGYMTLSGVTNIDFISSPGFLIDPIYFLECGVADFVICGCLPFAKQGDITMVTKKLNGGLIGLAQRKAWLTKWKGELHA